ncbi:MAG TPA: DUF2332 domain-containing protein [Pseudonocardiaceae bacterium]|nr:DUF2332 domain-containing protein [Pseudonocardiaceae bacterium]
MTATATDLDVVRKRLRRFAEDEAMIESPLYAHLALAASEDDDVAGLLAVAPPEFARPTLLFAAVHRLVLAEPVSDLANYYPTVGGEYGVDGVVWPTFRSFVLDRAAKVRELVATRTTQTNEVRRAALLYPAVARAAKQANQVSKGPIGLLELGTSAGLLLGLDRYGYRYQAADGEQLAAGPTKAPLVLSSVFSIADGAKRPPLPKNLAVAAKVGLDRNPIDLTDDEQLAWLEACVWADQPERVRLLNQAATAQVKDRPEFVTGDLVDDLAAAAARIPADLPLVVFNSHVLPYVPERRRPDFVAALAELAKERPLWWISQEAYGAVLRLVLPDRADLDHDGTSKNTPLGVLGSVRWVDGRAEAVVLARTAAHGERIVWLAT